jgi:Flp pilus assembly protein TadD
MLTSVSRDFAAPKRNPIQLQKYYKPPTGVESAKDGVVISGMLDSRTNPGVGILVLVALAAAMHAQSNSSKASTDALYARGMAALRHQDLNSARSAFEKVIAIAPRSPEAHNSLGWVLVSQGEVEAGIVQFRTAIKLKPAFPQAHLNLANALSQRQDFSDAESEAHEAVRLAPRDSEAHRTLGKVLSLRGELPGAINEMRTAVALEPQRPDLHDDLGSLLEQTGSNDEATEQFSKSLHIDPNFAAALLHLGIVRWQQKQLTESHDLLSRAVQAIPQNAQAPAVSFCKGAPHRGQCNAVACSGLGERTSRFRSNDQRSRT